METFIPKMRPCIRAGFTEGAQGRDHFEALCFAIIHDLKRIGLTKPDIKMALMEWNKRNYKSLSEGEARRQLADYVEWFFKKNPKLGCKSKQLTLLCVYSNGGCSFAFTPDKECDRLPFALITADQYLLERYPAHAYKMGAVLKTLFKKQVENGRKRIFVGLRSLQAILFSDFKICLDPKDILRLLNKLKDEQFIEIEPGQPGGFKARRRANEYTFLPWKPPQPIISHLCGNSDTLLCVATDNQTQKQEELCVQN